MHIVHQMYEILHHKINQMQYFYFPVLRSRVLFSLADAPWLQE